MKGIIHTKTHHADGAYVQFLAALAFAVAASALFAAPSEPYVCYKPDAGKSIYPWDHAAKWYDGVNGSIINRAPTTNDYVFLYSSKNDVSANGKPMVITNGVHAETEGLEICDKSHGNTFLIGVTVQDGGTMTNAGVVRVGNSGSGKTGGGLLTVESGGVWAANSVFMLGSSSGTSWLNVKPGGSFSCAEEFRVGLQSGGSGIVTNEGTMSVYDIFPGQSGTGIVVNKGDLTIARKLTIGRYANSFGHLILESGSSVVKNSSGTPVHIAFAENSTGILECRSHLKFSGSTAINVANGTDSTGRLVIGEGGAVSNASSIAIGAPSPSCGSVELHGGSLWVRGDNNGHRVWLGSDGETTTGRITGWGSVRRMDSTLRIRFFGQVVADGEGAMHDLNFASFKTVGSNSTEVLNACGTNGWFAVNKGRLIYPRAQNCSGASHPTIGDYPTRSAPTVMNSFRYTLAQPRPEGTYYNFAELYAPDREDIPRGLPVRGRDVVAGVWRFGLSSASGADIEPEPIAFTGMSLTFRYDWREMREGQTVVVYRHDGTENGTWTRVSRRIEISSTENTVTTDKFDPSSATWNAGWFAVVAQNYGSTTVIFR